MMAWTKEQLMEIHDRFKRLSEGVDAMERLCAKLDELSDAIDAIEDDIEKEMQCSR